MCGIAGWLGRGTDPDHASAGVRRMLGALARRGPDGEGLARLPVGALGHRRLAIYDLSAAGSQPMSTPDGHLTVTFNGAIYNFLELRAELEAAGFTFRSRTDTEVLLLGYRHWGIDGLLPRLRGMFAFGLFDAAAHRLLLVRDRLGVKPLLYARPTPGELAFASTAEALAAAGCAGGIDPAALAAVLQVGYVPDTLCIHQGIAKLPPGHLLEWTPGGAPELRRYWTSPPEEAGLQLTFEEAVDQAEAALLEAVRLRLSADVPVGCLLSAGVDSSLIAWAAARLQPDVRVFTVATPGDPADEAPAASRTAARLGLHHSIVTLGADPSEALDDLVAAFDEPFPCSSALGLLQVSRAIRPHATVLLTGDGGDEAFLGYPEHLAMLRSQRAAAWIPGPLGRGAGPAVAAALSRGAGALRRPLRMLDYAARGIQAVAVAQRQRWSGAWAGLAGDRLRDTAGYPPVPAQPGVPDHLLADYIRHQRETVFLGEYLPKVDRATMFHALESRSPFLDQELWALAAGTPHSVRLRGGQAKAVLRALAARRVSPEVAAGRKRGFTIPVERWLPTRWAAALERLEQNPVLVREGWLEARGVAGMVRAARASGHAPTILWHIVVAEAWLSRTAGAAAP